MIYIRKERNFNITFLMQRLFPFNFHQFSGTADSADFLPHCKKYALNKGMNLNNVAMFYKRLYKKSKRVEWLIVEYKSIDFLYKVMDKTMELRAFL